jgi:hypothetical protein
MLSTRDCGRVPSITLARFPDAYREERIILLPSQPHPHKSIPNIVALLHIFHLPHPSFSRTIYNMLLTSSLFMPSQQQYYNPYTPPRSSPLSERSANVTPRLFDFGMASHSNIMKSPTPQRAYKPNPVIQTRDAATKRRRDMFFKRVQNGREDKKWESRGEQVGAIKHSPLLVED